MPQSESQDLRLLANTGNAYNDALEEDDEDDARERVKQWEETYIQNLWDHARVIGDNEILGGKSFKKWLILTMTKMEMKHDKKEWSLLSNIYYSDSHHSSNGFFSIFYKNEM